MIDKNIKKPFWYKVALTRDKNDTNGGFKSNDCYGYIPSIQLSVCYDRLGESDKAIYYHEKQKKSNLTIVLFCTMKIILVNLKIVDRSQSY